MRRRALALAPPLALLALLLGGWEAYADTGTTSSFVLPAPHAVATALVDNAGLLAANLRPTAVEVGVGVLVALALGAALAILVHLSPPLRRAVYPVAVGSQAVPIAVIAPLLVFWWGFGVFPKLVVIVLICFFPVLVTTVDGLAGVDRTLYEAASADGASRWRRLWHVTFPALRPVFAILFTLAAIRGLRIFTSIWRWPTSERTTANEQRAAAAMRFRWIP